MKEITNIPQMSTPIPLLGVFVAILLGGCVNVYHHPAEQAALTPVVTCPSMPSDLQADELPCNTVTVPCGKNCANLNGLCAKPTGGIGRCKNVTAGPACNCACQ